MERIDVVRFEREGEIGVGACACGRHAHDRGIIGREFGYADKVEEVNDRVRQVDAGTRQPRGMEVRTDKVFVEEVEAWRGHLPADHAFGPLKVVGVVWRAVGGVGEDEGRLA